MTKFVRVQPGLYVYGDTYTFVAWKASTDANTQKDLQFMQDSDTLTVRGIQGVTSVEWRAGLAVDAVFDLLGDFDGNGNVGGNDALEWQRQFNSGVGNPQLETFSADGDDDGDVDGDDLDVFGANYDNWLYLFDILV